MSVLPTSRLKLAEARQLFEQWRDAVDEAADRFSMRVWGTECSARTFAWDDLRDAFEYLREHVVLIDETPDEELPLWLLPGRISPRPWPTAPDVRSAWLLDSYASWNVRLALTLWNGSEFFLYRSPMRSKDADHQGWKVGKGLHGATVRTLIYAATQLSWAQSGPHVTVQQLIDRQRYLFGGAEAAGIGDNYDDLFAVEVAAVEPGVFQIILGVLEFAQGRRERQLRGDLEAAIRGVSGVEEVGWEDREVAHVRGTTDQDELRRVCAAVLNGHRSWIRRLG